MTPDDARKLAIRITDTWPTGPKTYVWRDAILDLERDDAADTYRDLVHTAERPPTLAQYLAHYHAIRRRRTSSYRNQPDGTEISLGTYLTRVAQRAQRGDQDATEELERWERFLGTKGTA